MHMLLYPNGKVDYDAGVNELLSILDNKIDRQTASGIFSKARACAHTSSDFSADRLRLHLQPYALHFFNDYQLDRFFRFLMSCSILALTQHKGPSEIRIVNGDYYF